MSAIKTSCRRIGPKWRIELLANVVMGVAAVVTIVVALEVARMTFARGLKGFGLRPATIPKDHGAALVNLLAIWPLVSAVFTVVLRIREIPLWPYLSDGASTGNWRF